MLKQAKRWQSAALLNNNDQSDVTLGTSWVMCTSCVELQYKTYTIQLIIGFILDLFPPIPCFFPQVYFNC